MKVKHRKTTKQVLSQCLYFPEEWQYEKGVYVIHHIKRPNRIYIGSVTDESRYGGFLKRFKSHYDDLVSKKHGNILLQRAIDKFGIKGVRFTPLEIYPPSLCLGMEQYYLNILQPFYNICTTAGNLKGMKHSEETKDKFRKKIVQYSLDGDFIKVHRGQKTAAKNTNTVHGSIGKCAKGSQKTAGGFLWRFLEDVSDEKSILQKSIKAPVYEYQRGWKCKVVAYTLDGNFYKEYESMQKASKDIGFPSTNITAVVKGKKSRVGQYMFHYYTKGFKKKIKPHNGRSVSHQKKIKITYLETGESKTYKSLNAMSLEGGEVSLSTIQKKKRQGITKFKHPNKNPKYLIEVKSYK